MIIYSKGDFVCIHKGEEATLANNSYCVSIETDDMVPAEDAVLALIESSGGYLISDTNQYSQGVWTNVGDIYIGSNFAAYVCSSSAKSLKFHISSGTHQYKFSDLLPTNWISNTYSKLVGRPPLNFVTIGDETWMSEPDRELCGIDAEYYCFKGYDLLAAYGIVDKQTFVVPVPFNDASFEYIKKVYNGEAGTIGFEVPCEPFEDTSDGVVFTDDVQVDIKSMKSLMASGKKITLDNYSGAVRAKFMGTANDQVSTTMLFGVSTYDASANMDYCLFTGSDAAAKIDQCIVDASFKVLADAYLCNDYINQVINKAGEARDVAIGDFLLERCKAIKSYGDQLVVLVPDYVQKFLDTLTATNEIQFDAGLFDFSYPAIPEQGSRTAREWLSALCTAVGKGFDSSLFEDGGSLSDLPDSVKTYVEQLVKDAVDENVEKAKTNLNSFNDYVKRINVSGLASRVLTQTYYILWVKKQKEHQAVKEVSTTLDENFSIVGTPSLTKLDDNYNVLNFTFTVAPYLLEHYKLSHDAFKNDIVSAIVSNAGDNVSISYRGRSPIDFNKGSRKLGFTSWNWFCGIKEIRGYWENVGVDYDVSEGYKFDVAIKVATSQRHYRLDLSNSETFSIAEADANTYGWRVYAEYLADNANFIAEDLLSRRPLVYFKDQYASIDEAAAFGNLLRDVGFMDDAISSINQNYSQMDDVAKAKVDKALEIMRVIRDTMSTTTIKDPCKYITEAMVVNSDQYISDPEVFLYIFDMVRAIPQEVC